MMADNGCFAETSGKGSGQGQGFKKVEIACFEVSRCGVGGGGFVSCMNPVRRAIKGFIWSVRLSEAEPSRNRRFLALNSL